MTNTTTNDNEEQLEMELFDESDDGAIYIDNAAVFTIDYEANQLIVYFGGDRSATMELDDDVETMICDKVLADPNFWANFLGSLSAALKKTSK